MTQNRSNFADAYRKIYEKLKPSDGAGAYIDDFRKSDAPQFKGKSDEKIQKMAVAAYLDDKDKAKNEQVEIVYTDKKTRKVVSKKFKNDKEARKFIKQFKGAAGQINFKPSSLVKKEELELEEATAYIHRI